MQHVEGRLAGVAGVELHWQGWLPGDAPRGALLICHGMGEHSGRYATVVDTLIPDGWAVYGMDHRGHGSSAGTRVHVRPYADFLADVDTFRCAVAARHPGLRPFLLGHSMGGQIALAYALDHEADLAGLVLSAPALQAPPVSRATRVAVSLLARVAPTMRRAVVDVSAISRDEAVVADYRADALVYQGHPTISLSLAMLDQMTLLAARARDLRLPPPAAARHRGTDCHIDGSRALEQAVDRTTSPCAGTTGSGTRSTTSPSARSRSRTSGVARRARLLMSGHLGRCSTVGRDWAPRRVVCSHVSVQAAILGEIWGTRRAHHFDQCCRPS